MAVSVGNARTPWETKKNSHTGRLDHAYYRAMEAPGIVRRILVVDDEEAVRSVLVRALGLWGYAVESVEDGEQALRLIGADPAAYAGVLLDLTMPGMSGDQVFRRIAERAPALPVLLMSGYGSSEAESRLDGARPAGFLQKPFDLGVLKAAVAEMIAG